MKKDEIVVNYYGLILLYFCNYEREELQMNGAFMKTLGKSLLQSVCILAATYSVSFVYGYGSEQGKFKARDDYYKNEPAKF